MKKIKEYLSTNLEGFEFIGDLRKGGRFYYFTVELKKGDLVNIEKKSYQVTEIDFSAEGLFLVLRIEASYLEYAVSDSNFL